MAASEGTATEIDVEHNTPGWHLVRGGPLQCRLGSSDMGTATGINTWESRSEFFWKRVREEHFEGNDATRHGHKYEEDCAQLYVKWTGAVIRAGKYHIPIPETNPLFTKNDHLYFGASVDRLGSEIDLECKCPFTKRSWENNYARDISLTHLAQLHLQMAIRGRSRIHYMVTLFDTKSGELEKARLCEVYFNQEFWNWIYPKARDMAIRLLRARYDWKIKPSDLVPIDFDSDWGMPPSVSYRELFCTTQ